MPRSPAHAQGALRAYREETVISGGVPIVLSVWERHPLAATVLFYPGTMASPLMYRFFLEELRRMGLNVAGLHPLSHGRSPRLKKNFVFEDILRNGLDAAAWIRQRMDGPVVVAGHSQGGIFTLAHAARDPRTGAAFPIGALLPRHPQAILATRFHRLAAYREHLSTALRIGARLAPRLPVIIPFYLEIRRIMAGAVQPHAHRRHMRLSYPLCFINSLFTADLSSVSASGNINCPVMLTTARDDALFPASLMRAMLDQVAAPQKKLLLLDGGGHMAPLCKRFATDIATRMAEHCAGFGLPLHDCGLTS